jgi:hypothetical protein
MYNFNPLVHLAVMSDTLKKLGLRGELQFESFRFEVAGAGQYIELVPEFLSRSPEQFAYHESITPEVVIFAGWRIGPRRHWDGAGDKLRFKDYCTAHQLRTPRVYDGGSSGNSLVLLKEKIKPPARRGIIEGPFPLSQVARRSPSSDVFAEEYVDGKSVQAWYFDGKLACVEIRDKPTVTGDGKRTLRELVQARYYGVGLLPLDWPVVESLGVLHDLSLDSRVPAGTVVTVDVRYNSHLHRVVGGDENVLPQIAGSPVHEQLVKAGPSLWQAIPEHLRTYSLFSVRAVIDAHGHLWFTDMDPDRYVHPGAYATMLTGLFGLPEQPPSQSIPIMAQTPPALLR